jgi:hypothetical protein
MENAKIKLTPVLPPSLPSPTGEGVHVSIFQDVLSLPLCGTGKGVYIKKEVNIKKR